ncbi:cation:proton antiporter family protein [Pontivivens insulae]|uniref:Inner membrane protein YbaL n=1 Tax=Pontivivens insulae TaxID=1639689 RepID=A0A2R8AA18_9RHOB|nr:cation:proton antiporter family protein [Pontivivens insulae]RED12839.1 transporter (CPA2 family) [Pontivivens insulae]SPF28930.1 Inner membrane protein YbaL [Pontivivens insulae]
MAFELFVIGAAFLFGMAMRPLGLPPLIGFLIAGFTINMFGPDLGMSPETGPILDYVADLGVVLLLFTVGLKLKLRQIGNPPVVGGALLHFALSVALFSPVAYWFFSENWLTALLVGIALAFSSTVLSAKLLEAKREMRVYHGRVAIGILIVQDIIALVVLAVFAGDLPGPWALLIFAAPLLRPVIYRILDMAGRDEMLLVTSVMLALVVGGVGFEAIGLKGEIGALVMGLIVSGHARAEEVGKALWAVKELFLVGFFLSIGMSGLPDMEALIFAAVMALLLPLKGVLFFALLVAFGLRVRSAFLAALSLTAYSEFGLIVAAGIPDAEPFLVPLAIALSLSFIIAAPLNRNAHRMIDVLEPRLARFERKTRRPDEKPADLGTADILILGMGRTGHAAYDAMVEAGRTPIGLDGDTYRVEELKEADVNVIFADAEDASLWSHVDISGIHAAVLAMNDIEAKLIAARALRKKGFDGPIVAHAFHADELQSLGDAGADRTHLTLQETGRSLTATTLGCLSDHSA